MVGALPGLRHRQRIVRVEHQLDLDIIGQGQIRCALYLKERLADQDVDAAGVAQESHVPGEPGVCWA